jgi:hypothetical protein
LSRFVKDVRTLADAGELTEMLESVRGLVDKMKRADQEVAA